MTLRELGFIGVPANSDYLGIALERTPGGIDPRYWITTGQITAVDVEDAYGRPGSFTEITVIDSTHPRFHPLQPGVKWYYPSGSGVWFNPDPIHCVTKRDRQARSYFEENGELDQFQHLGERGNFWLRPKPPVLVPHPEIYDGPRAPQLTENIVQSLPVYRELVQ